MLKDLVENKFGMKFMMTPSNRSNLASDTVYFVEMNVGGMKESFNSNDANLRIDGGIVWEPVYSDVLSSETRAAKSIITTNELSPGHVCCVLAVNSTYLESNGEDVIRFLRAYADVVDWMNAALDDPNSPEYGELVQMAMEFTNKTEPTVRASFEGVVYKYDLTGIKAEIEELAVTYERVGLVNNSLQDIGYQSGEEFANALVKENYLADAVGKAKSDYADAPQITIKMAHLIEDIHQLALYVGGSSGLDIFGDYNITIDASAPQSQGGQVAQALIRGDANIGFLGAPPVVQNTINMGR